MSEEEIDVIYRIGIFARRVLHRIRRDHPMAISEELCGGCAIGSYLFHTIAKQSGMASEMVYGKVDGSTHVWCLLDRRTVVDVTMTQFGSFPAVYVVDADDALHDPETYGPAALARANRWARLDNPARFQAPVLHYERLHRAVDRVFGSLTADAA